MVMKVMRTCDQSGHQRCATVEYHDQQMIERHVDIAMHAGRDVERSVLALAEGDAVADEGGIGDVGQDVGAGDRAADIGLRQHDSELLQQAPGAGAGTEQNVACFHLAPFGGDTADGAARSFDRESAAPFQDDGTQVAGAQRKGSRCLARFGMAIALGIETAAYLAGEVGQHVPDFGGAQQARVQDERTRRREPFLPIGHDGRRAAGIERAAFIPFEVAFEFPLQAAPQFLASLHQGYFVRVAHLDAHKAPGARTLLPGDARLVDQHHLHAGLGHVIGAGASLDAGADDDDIGRGGQGVRLVQDDSPNSAVAAGECRALAFRCQLPPAWFPPCCRDRDGMRGR